MQIIAVCLIKNEEFYIEQVITNIIDFCDKIIVLDNKSEDDTYAIVARLAKDYPKIELVSLDDIKESHAFVEPYAGTDTWIFAVDGDEVYDPKGLKILRAKILSGYYQDYFQVRGHFFHCADINIPEGTAIGYFGPPACEVTKLYNLSLLTSWKANGKDQRAGQKIGTILPKIYQTIYESPVSPRIKEKLGCYKLIYSDLSWQESFLRCVHLRFIPRSSLEKTNKFLNPRINLRGFQSKTKFQLRDSYRKGKISKINDLNMFFDQKFLHPKNSFAKEHMMNIYYSLFFDAFIKFKILILKVLKKILPSNYTS